MASKKTATIPKPKTDRVASIPDLEKDIHVQSYRLTNRQLEEFKKLRVVKDYRKARDDVEGMPGSSVSVNKFLKARKLRMKNEKDGLKDLERSELENNEEVKSYLKAYRTQTRLADDVEVVKFIFAESQNKRMAATNQVQAWKRAKEAKKLYQEAGLKPQSGADATSDNDVSSSDSEIFKMEDIKPKKTKAAEVTKPQRSSDGASRERDRASGSRSGQKSTRTSVKADKAPCRHSREPPSERN